MTEPTREEEITVPDTEDTREVPAFMSDQAFSDDAGLDNAIANTSAGDEPDDTLEQSARDHAADH